MAGSLTFTPSLICRIIVVSVEAVVEFDYQAAEEDELSLVKGDIITNVSKLDGGWWEGTLNGKTGMFPDNFVKVLKLKYCLLACISGLSPREKMLGIRLIAKLCEPYSIHRY